MKLGVLLGSLSAAGREKQTLLQFSRGEFSNSLLFSWVSEDSQNHRMGKVSL